MLKTLAASCRVCVWRCWICSRNGGAWTFWNLPSARAKLGARAGCPYFMVMGGVSHAGCMVTCGGGEYIDVAQLGYHNCDANDMSTVGRPTVVEKYLVIACSSPLVVPPDEAFRFGLGATAIPLCPVGFDKDITGICTALQRSNRRINVVVTFSTLSAFVGIVASKPMVLHFVGHAVAPVRVPAAAVHLPACLLLESNGSALLADAVSLRDCFLASPTPRL
jgi:hypothetical protein